MTEHTEYTARVSSTIDAIRLVFGLQDANLRKIQDVLPVRVVSVENEIRITGNTEKAVDEARQVFEELCQIASRRRQISDRDLDRVLAPVTPIPKMTAEDAEPLGELQIRPAGIVSPKTQGQARYMNAIRDSDLVFCSGPAGSGKTYLAVALALEALKAEQVRKLVLVRPAVEAGEKLGFLPGDLLAKVNPFLRPLLDALRDMLDYDQVQRYMEHDVIEIVPLAFMRGRTLNETFMILDEAQNTTVTQMKMFLTRMGTGSKIVVTGDQTQNDLPPHVTSGLNDAMKRLRGIPGTSAVKLDGRDIVRHRLVREIVKAYDIGSSPNRSSE
ncbi:PhoH family protein [Rubinisphaera margarita]|uniref:PhoH family protein n=1 Tax=Rubinisphaera margarita TaxID=2909586 RepID=UPI001EE8858F|nr:PhoH family protein [Rubinisphaera margarita]MCG6154260.1 PhoH family protein [Rubinisphaera margarita]